MSVLKLIHNNTKTIGDLPDDLVIEITKCKTAADVKQVGIEWCTAQSKELKERGVPALHYYSMGRSEGVKQIVNEVF